MVARFVVLAVGAAALAGCGSTGANYRPIVDGPTGYAYERDLAACRSVAERRALIDDEAKGKMLLGAAIGGLLGAAEASSGRSTEGALGGAAVGASVAAGAGALDAQGDRKKIVINCMTNRGHNVVG